MRGLPGIVAAVLSTAISGAVLAQAAPSADLALQAAPPAEQELDSLKVYFDTGSASVAADQQATLDQAARLFRDGSPIVMIVAAGADTVGAADANLELSIERAQAVVDGLVARGIPADRLQLLGRGISELAVETGEGVDRRENRVAEITWR